MPSSATLVGLARQGDEQAFEALVRAHQDRAYVIALRLTGNPHDAQDATQEAFLNAWKGLDRFRDDAEFNTWLTRIVINSCHRQRRSHRPTEPLTEATATATAPAADTVAEAQQRREAAGRAIAELPFEQRVALVLHVFAGHPHGEVARILGISEGAAKVRVHRARRAVAAALQQWEGGR